MRIDKVIVFYILFMITIMSYIIWANWYNWDKTRAESLLDPLNYYISVPLIVVYLCGVWWWERKKEK